MEHVDLERPPRRVGGAGQGVEERRGRPGCRGHELVPVAVIGEAQAGIAGGLAETVEGLRRLRRVVTGERAAVRDPRADDRARSERLHLGERARGIVAQSLEAHVGGLAAKARRVESGPKLRHRVVPETRPFHFAESEPPHPGQRSGQVLGQILAQAPELEADGAVQRTLDLRRVRRPGAPDPDRAGPQARGHDGEEVSPGGHGFTSFVREYIRAAAARVPPTFGDLGRDSDISVSRRL